MMRLQYDLIIIGAGLAGSSLAAYCSKLNIKILLIDEGVPGAQGATSVSRGIIRLYDPNDKLMKINLSAITEWDVLSKDKPYLFNKVGSYYILDNKNIESAREKVTKYSNDSYPIELIDTKDLLKQMPQLNAEYINSLSTLAIWEPKGGYIQPRLVTQMFVSEAKKNNVIILEGTKVDKVYTSNNIAHINIGNNSSISAKVVVVAAGAKTEELISTNQIFCRSIPLSLVRSNNYEQKILESCLIEENSGTYFRPESNDFFYIGGATQVDAANLTALYLLNTNTHDEHEMYLKKTLNTTNDIYYNYMGYDGYTSNYLPIISFLNKNIAIFSGFSGRGAKYIPHVAKKFTNEIKSHFM